MKNVVEHSGARRVVIALDSKVKNLLMLKALDGGIASPNESSGEHELRLQIMNNRAAWTIGISLGIDNAQPRSTRVTCTFTLGR